MMIPGTMGFVSAHALINKERVLRGLLSLQRSAYLDLLCRNQAKYMAQHQELSHSVDTLEELKELLNTESSVAENIQRGPNVKAMHENSMKARQTAYRSILSNRFTECGTGTAKGEDGRLYMVQLFRGPVIPHEIEPRSVQ